MVRALVVTVSDRSSRGEQEDRSGPLLASLLAAEGLHVEGPVVVGDDRSRIEDTLRAAIAEGYSLVVTTGGTGLGPRDVTPEATRAVIEREAPGIAECIRAAGAMKVPAAWLSRGCAGIARHTLVVNLAGSPGAVSDGVAAMASFLGHAIDQLGGGDHPPANGGSTSTVSPAASSREATERDGT